MTDASSGRFLWKGQATDLLVISAGAYAGEVGVTLLHDGRTRDLLDAIAAHASQADANFPASEGNAVTAAFDALSEQRRQDVLNFLRAL